MVLRISGKSQKSLRRPLIIGWRPRSGTTRSTSLGYVQFRMGHRDKVNLARRGFKKNYCFVLDPLTRQKLISTSFASALKTSKYNMTNDNVDDTGVNGPSTSVFNSLNSPFSSLVKRFSTPETSFESGNNRY